MLQRSTIWSQNRSLENIRSYLQFFYIYELIPMVGCSPLTLQVAYIQISNHSRAPCEPLDRYAMHVVQYDSVKIVRWNTPGRTYRQLFIYTC